MMRYLNSVISPSRARAMLMGPGGGGGGGTLVFRGAHMLVIKI